MMDNRLEIVLAARDITGKAFTKVQSEIMSLGKSVFSLNGAIVTMAGVTGFGMLVQRSMAVTAEIERNAKMAGVGVEAYQELTFAAKQHQITQDAMTDGLKELALRTDEYVKTGVGPSQEAFERLGYSQEQLNGMLKDTPGLLTDIITRMEGLDTAAKIRVADELFGGSGGEQFVAMIQAGAKSLIDFRREAHSLGVVISEDMIRNTVDAKREVEKLTSVLGSQFHSTVAILAPDISGIAKSMTQWTVSNKEFIRQEIPGYFNDIKIAVTGIGTALAFVGRGMGALSNDSKALGIVAGGQMSWHEFLSNSVEEQAAAIRDFDKKNSGPTRYTINKDTPGYDRYAAGDAKGGKSPVRINAPDESGRIAAETSAQFWKEAHEKRYADFLTMNGSIMEGERVGNEYVKALAMNQVTVLADFNESKAADFKSAHEQMYADFKKMNDKSEIQLMKWSGVMVDNSETTAKAMENAFVGWGSNFSSMLNDMVWESGSSFDDILRSFGKMVTQMVIQKEIVEPFMGMAGGGISSMLTSFFHAGGVVGSGDGRDGSVSAMAFAGAPRFHGGLMPDEFPAILQRGEGVFTQAQMRALGGAVNQQPLIKIEVINNTGQETQVKTRQPSWDGEKWVLGVVLDAVGRNKGNFATSLRAGLTR